MDEIYGIIPVSQLKNAKTRLSPFLSENERKELLKVMLKDVTCSLKKYVDKLIIISHDENVLKYSKKLGLSILKENNNSNLNKALKQAMDYCFNKTKKVIITPSDIPLIVKTNIQTLINSSKKTDFIIAPSKGGGTNALIMKPHAIKPQFGQFSYKKHINMAKNENLTPQTHDSFFISLDINTIEDLGEILIHGENTNTYHLLKDLKINVKSIHANERLKITRE